MPEVTTTKEENDKEKFREYKRKIYHQVWYNLLESVRESQKQGGFLAKDPDGCRQKFMPYVCILINDNPEGHLMTGVKSVGTHRPCRMCKCIDRFIAEPWMGTNFALRDFDESSKIRIEASNARTLKERNEILYELSCKKIHFCNPS